MLRLHLAERQHHHDNVEATTAEAYYHQVMAVPMLGTFISEMNLVTASKQLYLVLLDPVLNLESVVHMYRSHEIVDQEIWLWKKTLAKFS